MSILIKGMEMPRSCAECPVNMNICKRGYKYLLAHMELYDQRADDCPIAPVPPHGRLIDADALRYWSDDSAMIAFDYVTRSQINAAPIIIPAEEVKES